jgi:hypothetical protein
MNKHGNLRFSLRLGFLLAFAGVLFAQSTPDKILVVNGRTAGPAVREIDGHSYVDIETLAKVTNGSVTIETGRILLTIPGSAPAAASSTSAPAVAAVVAAAPLPEGLSRGFAAAAIADLSEMREWRGAVAAMVTYGGAASPGLAQDYQGRVQAALGQAGVAAITSADHEALQLLQNESDTLASWANGVLAARQNFNGAATVDPNSLTNDPALAKIRNCGQFLNSMLVSGTFADDASCH